LTRIVGCSYTAAMPNIPSSGPQAGSMSAILDHRPEIRAAWEGLDATLLGPSSTLPVALKENVRRTLAQELGCRFCNSFGPPEEPADVAESLAIAFAQLALEDHTSIGPGHFEVLREEFTEEQIVELCTWVCFKIGSNMLGAVVGLEPSTEQDRRDYAAMLAEASAVQA
jgi:alkylhydroperoxidase family enzyme